MMKDNHGANIFDIARNLNIQIGDIKDFSSNINPFGPSKIALKSLEENLSLVSTYPDSTYYDLKKSIATYTGADFENIYLGSGTTQLIREYIKSLNPKKALLLAPSYSEYENELKRNKSKIFYYNLLEEDDFKIDIEKLIKEIKSKQIDLLVFANPNNPTGSILTKTQIEKILTSSQAKLLVDETYIEFTDKEKYSCLELVKKYPQLLVLRGVSKFFACPGIRLGYCISKNEILKDSLLWSINIFADLMARSMFGDYPYQKNVFDFIEVQREKIFCDLENFNEIKAFKSEGNFILCKILGSTSAKDLRKYLLEQGIVIRDCSSFKGLGEKYFRFCLLNESDNEKLINAIKKYFTKD